MIITKEQVSKAVNEFLDDNGFNNIELGDKLSEVGLDSLDQVDLTMHLEEVFQMDIDDNAIPDEVRTRDWTLQQWADWLIEHAKDQ